MRLSCPPPPSLDTFLAAYLEVPSQVAQIPSVIPAVLKAASLGTRWAYSDVLRYAWYVSIPFSVLPIVACLSLRNLERFV